MDMKALHKYTVTVYKFIQIYINVQKQLKLSNI